MRGSVCTARGARRGCSAPEVLPLVGPADLLLRVEPFEHEIHSRRPMRRRAVRFDAGDGRQVVQSLHGGRARKQFVRGQRVIDAQRPPELEPFDDLCEVGGREPPAEHGVDGVADDLARHVIGAA